MRVAGYIVVDDCAIWGGGDYPSDAWDDLAEGMRIARVPHISEVDVEDENCPRYWCEEQFRLLPASAALLEALEECGGQVEYGTVNDLAVTWHEYVTSDA